MPITIIAELGINHNGNLSLAKDLIRMSKDAGADLVKFQKRDIPTVYSKEFLDSPRKSPWGATQRDQKQGLEFGEDQYLEIDCFCSELGIPWFASAWDLKSLEFLDQFNLPHNKIASAMATHCDFLKAVADRKKHTFISTGMCTTADVEKAVDIFQRRGCPYTLMHCVAAYPCEDKDTNLLMIRTLADRYGLPIGYSSHDVGVGPSIIAVVLGATVIEKHVTLDRAMYGSDQAASLEPKGLAYMIKECRGVASCLGDGRKSINDIEQGVAKKLRYWEENG